MKEAKNKGLKPASPSLMAISPLTCQTIGKSATLRWIHREERALKSKPATPVCSATSWKSIKTALRVVQ